MLLSTSAISLAYVVALLVGTNAWVARTLLPPGQWRMGTAMLRTNRPLRLQTSVCDLSCLDGLVTFFLAFGSPVLPTQSVEDVDSGWWRQNWGLNTCECVHCPVRVDARIRANCLLSHDGLRSFAGGPLGSSIRPHDPVAVAQGADGCRGWMCKCAFRRCLLSLCASCPCTRAANICGSYGCGFAWLGVHFAIQRVTLVDLDCVIHGVVAIALAPCISVARFLVQLLGADSVGRLQLNHSFMATSLVALNVVSCRLLTSCCRLQAGHHLRPN